MQEQVSMEVGENLGDTMEGKQRDSVHVPELEQRRNNETKTRRKQENKLKKKLKTKKKKKKRKIRGGRIERGKMGNGNCLAVFPS